VLNVRRLILPTILLLIIFSLYVVHVSFPTGAQTEYSIDVQGYTWDHSTISISILPQENETWWEPSYHNATLHGIAQWNDAIQDFASKYPDFSYISNLHLVPTISYELVPGFDIYMKWRAECDCEDTIGETSTTTKYPCTIVNNTVLLSAKAPSGHIMTESNMQNIVVHEIGHAFGLSHSNYSSNIMYATVDYKETVKPVSSLDLYAISQIFDWMSNSTQLNSSIMCPEKSVLTMPSSISYVHFPITAENLPISSNDLIDYVIGLFSRLESLTLIIVIVTLIVVTVIILKRRKN